MKRKKQALTLLLASVLAVSLTACGGAGNASSAGSASETQPAPVSSAPESLTSGEPEGSRTLKIAMPVNSKIVDLHTNQLTLWLEERLDMELEFVELSTDDTDTQVHMMMTSGDLPDVLIGYVMSYATMCEYADAGLLMDISGLIDQVGTEEGIQNFLRNFEVDNIMSYVSYQDGVYAMPSGGAMFSNMYAGYPGRINGLFLEALNMELPRTLEDYYDFLVAVRDHDVNGNGDPDDEVPSTSATIALQSLFGTLGNAFQYTDSSTFMNCVDGKISFIGSNGLYREFVEFLKKLVDEDLLDPAAFTQDGETLLASQTTEPNLIGSMLLGNMISSCMDTDTEAYANMEILPALTGPHGYQATSLQVPSVLRAGFVTTSCQNPELAVRFLDFLLTEECSTAFRLGFEGSEWTVAPEGVNGRNGEQAKYQLLKPQEWIQPSTNVIWCTEANNYCQVMNYVYDGPDSTTGRVGQGILEANLTETVVDEYVPALLMDMETATEYGELQTMITDYVKTNTFLFVLGDRSLDDWDAYCAELNDMGVERYVELTQAAYDAMH